MKSNQTIGFQDVHDFLSKLFDGDLHAKRVLSLANATTGVIRKASLAVNTIGQGLALARGLTTKHAVKQVDRLLSNEGIDVDAALRHWVPYAVGPRTSINVAMDWTDFDADGQTTIMLSLMTHHGRTTPLVWLTVETATLKDNRNEYEYQVLVRLADALPAGIKVCIVADRGFGDQKLYRFLTEQLSFDYVIRFRGNITVTSAAGDTRTGAGWIEPRSGSMPRKAVSRPGPGGRATVLPDASVTADRYQVGTVVCVRDKDMKQAWCLASNRTNARASDLKRLYGKRWGIESGFRDTKDIRFGMGMAAVHVSTPARRDRLWLLNALAVALLTLLGAAGEALGYDRHLKTKTAKRRTHSLFTQGCMLYDLIPTMPAARLLPLIERFAAVLAGQAVFADTFGVIDLLRKSPLWVSSEFAFGRGLFSCPIIQQASNPDSILTIPATIDVLV